MSIVVSSAGSFDLETYGGLQTYIAEVLDRGDLTDQIPNFIHLAEYRIKRELLHIYRQDRANVTTTAGLATVALPADFRQLVAASIAGVPLEQSATAALYEGYNGAASAEPRAFSIGNGTLRLAPTPDAAYVIALDYIKDITPLSSEVPTNWVLTNHADIYVYGALLQAEAYLSNDERLAIWARAFDVAIDEANRQGLRYRNSGSPLRLKSPVCV